MEFESILDLHDDLPFWSSHPGITLLNNIPLRKNIKILDIGCGTGFPTLELAQRIGKSSNVYGLDIWREGIKKAVQKQKSKKIFNVKFTVSNAEKLPYIDNMFDLVVSNNGITAMDNKKAVLNEVYRALKNNGKLIFTAIMPETMNLFYEMLVNIMREEKIPFANDKVNAHINKRRLSISNYKELLYQSGLELKDYSYRDYEMKFVDGETIFNYSFFKLYFVKGWYEIVQDSKRNCVFNRLKEELDRFAIENNGISLNIKYAIMICEKRRDID